MNREQNFKSRIAAERRVVRSIFFTAVAFLIGTPIFNSCRKEYILSSVIAAVEEYKAQTGHYPEDLSELGKEYEWIEYNTDSSRTRFPVYYSSGIMHSNLNHYDSNSVKWEQTFSY